MLERLAQYVRRKVRAFASPQATQQPENTPPDPDSWTPDNPNDQEKTKSSNSESLTKDNSQILSESEAEESFQDAILAGLDQVIEDLGLREKKPPT